MNMNLKASEWAIFGTVLVAIIVLLAMQTKRDEALMQASKTYEDCVLEQYGITPTAWYVTHKEYPTCNK